MTNEATKDAEETATAATPAGTNPTNGETPQPINPEATATATEVSTEPAEMAEQTATETAVSEASPAINATEDPASSGDVDFGAILEQFEQEQKLFYSGEMVNGDVVGVSDRGVLVDFGYKSEGFVRVEEFMDDDGNVTVQVGDKVDVVIKSIHSGDGAPQLSRHDAMGRKVWDEIETAFREETPVIGKIMEKTRGGLKVDLNGVEAFLPGSQIDSRPASSLDSYIGQDIEAKIIKFSRRRSNIVLSRKILTDEVVNAQKDETLSKIELGQVVEGTIKNLTNYGAFVDIGGIDGLLHVTDMSWGRLNHPSDMFKPGDHIQVKILKLDREKDKISLGYKQLLPDPWSTVIEVYPVESKVTGLVSSVTEYGIFVELEPGVEGLVHVSEVSWSRRAQSPKKMFQKGQPVEVQVLGVDTVERRISLGMKQFQENPWDNVDIRFPVGARITGKVRNITEFGAFIELEEGIDGLVHISDLTWSKKIKHPKDLLKKDQEVEAIVTSIDKRGQRLSLSMKDLTPSAWEGFIATHRPGDVVKGKVSRFTNFGVFVELGDGLEGLCHISELSDDRIENAESVANIGDEMEFKILRIEPADQKIGLSHRAIGKEGEPNVDSRIYSSEAKGGMASLGELANLKFGNADPESAAEEKPAKKVSKKKAKAAEAETPAEEAPAAEAEATPEATAEAVEIAGEEPAASDEVPTEDTPSTEVETAPEEAAATVEEPVSEKAEAEPAAEETVEAPSAETDDSSSEDVASETTVSEDAPPEDAPSEDTASEDTASEDAPPEEVPTEEAATKTVEESSEPAAEPDADAEAEKKDETAE
jgi:small subunit ribosomal protein S1